MRKLVVSLAGLLLLVTADVGAADQATPNVLAVYPHDTAAFTQGLVYHQGSFYESTGLYGQSKLRRVKIADGSVQQEIGLSSSEFGEGLARVGNELIQLTWRENVAHRYDLASFGAVGDHGYTGEGWGLCYDGTRLVMSNGSSNLYFRDPSTFALEGQVQVTLDGSPIGNLNELECVGSLVYANVWLTDTILRIDPATGVVLTEIDASGLLTPAEAAGANVLNGIAFNPSTDRFYLTGKLWPKVFEVDFPFDPYAESSCQTTMLQPVIDLVVDKGSGAGIEFHWPPQAHALEYHVNSVDDIAYAEAPGPHRPDLPGGFGVPVCETDASTTTCSDIDGQSRATPILYYQVYSACGPLGTEEGP